MKLNDYDRQTALWKKISGELEERLQVLREKNDGNLDVTQTADVRGGIRTIKEILDWAKTDPIIQ